MNGLSWLLYLAEVSGNVGAFLWVVFGACVVASIVLTISGAAIRDFSEFKPDPEKAHAAGVNLHKKIPPLMIAAVVIGCIATTIPSKNTVMLIAASEVGQNILASDTAQKVGGEAGEIAVDSLRLLRKYLDEQLGETKPE